MRIVPESINRIWIEGLTDADLVDCEARVHEKFALLERREKRARGEKYQLFRGPADLMAAWDTWSRLSAATRERSLRPRRDPPTGA
jgi:hypothetical protein